MVVTCSNCEARLRLDDAKVPSRQFKVHCPKCKAEIDVRPQASSPDASSSMPVLDEMTPPSGNASPFEPPVVAPPFRSVVQLDDAESHGHPKPAPDLNDIARLLTSLQNNESNSNRHPSKQRPALYRRKVLVCASPEYREIAAQALAARDYEVFIAENTPEALGRMREDKMDVLILDANF